MEKAFIIGVMAIITLESGSMIRDKVMGLRFGRTRISMKEVG
jgi:hypothetical protein